MSATEAYIAAFYELVQKTVPDDGLLLREGDCYAIVCADPQRRRHAVRLLVRRHLLL